MKCWVLLVGFILEIIPLLKFIFIIKKEIHFETHQTHWAHFNSRKTAEIEKLISGQM